jgi:hypothetical protein
MFGAIYGSNLVLGLNRGLSAPQSTSPPPPSPTDSGRLRRVLMLQNTYPAPPPPTLPIPWRRTTIRCTTTNSGRPRSRLAGAASDSQQRGSSTTPCVVSQCRSSAGRPSSSRGPAVGPSARVRAWGWMPASSAPPPLSEINAVIDWEQQRRCI